MSRTLAEFMHTILLKSIETFIISIDSVRFFRYSGVMPFQTLKNDKFLFSIANSTLFELESSVTTLLEISKLAAEKPRYDDKKPSL